MITLYSTDCPRCKMLENKLDQFGINYTICKDKNTMLKYGFSFLPVLKVDDKFLNFKEAIRWINERKGIV